MNAGVPTGGLMVFDRKGLALINKDYILRLAERIGRELSILLGLRKRDEIEEGLITIDDLLVRSTGLTSRFINSLSEDMLLKSLSPLGKPNIEAFIWVAALLKTEGILYERLGQESESYYRYVKSLYLFLEVFQHEQAFIESEYMADIKDLLLKLEIYELPAILAPKIMRYYEQLGLYAKAEDILTEHLETHPDDAQVVNYGYEFYQRLQSKSNADLQAGNFSREEIQEGISHLGTITTR
jgi:hypothetical protein